MSRRRKIDPAKRRQDARAVLSEERLRLETLAVNPQSPELLKFAAPEHYHLLCNYFDRRVRELSD